MARRIESMSFLTSPPEIISNAIHSGIGSGPMNAAAGAWNTMAEHLGSSAESFSSVTSDLAGNAWQGAASQKMAAVAATYTQWLRSAETTALGSAAQAGVVAN